MRSSEVKYYNEKSNPSPGVNEETFDEIPWNN